MHFVAADRANRIMSALEVVLHIEPRGIIGAQIGDPARHGIEPLLAHLLKGFELIAAALGAERLFTVAAALLVLTADG